MSSLSMRALGRRKVAIVAAALLAFGGFAVARAQASAQAHETELTLNMTCSLAGALPVKYTVDHEPPTATAGEMFTITTKSVPQTNSATAGIVVKTMTITIPAPFGVASAGDIMVMGGNLTKSGQTTSGNSTVLSLTANAGVTVGTMQVPELMIPVKIANEVPETIVFEGPSKIALGIEFNGTPLAEECTANADNPPLLSVKPVGGTVVATTTTTKPKTSTTKAGEGGATGSKSGAVKATPKFTG